MSLEEMGKEARMPGAYRSKGVVLAAMSAVTFLVLGLGGVAHAQYVAWSVPENLGDVVNTPYNEDLPHLGPDGISLYFISNRPGRGGFDIWVSRRSSPYHPWGPPRNLGPMINGSSDERGPCLSRDGHYLFFSSNRAGGYGSQDLWMSYRWDTTNDFGWQPPVNLGDGVNTIDPDFGAAFIEDQWGMGTLLFGRRVDGGQSDIYRSERHWDGSFGYAVRVWELSTTSDDLRPTVRLDGLELYFNSNRPGSQGNDLWVSWRPSTYSNWFFPRNLGPTVNTSSEEQFPALSPDARTLVFSSNRPGGRGGSDLYISTRESEPWPYYDYWPHY
jgi:hypothetical protein